LADIRVALVTGASYGLGAAAALAILALNVYASAQAAENYPAKPVRFLVGPGPGSGTDIMARAIALKLTERIGQPVIVDNRPVAGGTVAIALAAKATPDGHTLLFVSGSLVIHPFLYQNLSYDPVRDLAPVTLIGVVPQVLVVNPGLAARNMAEFIALAKEKPAQINYGSGGVGSTGHLAGELLQSMAGIRLTHVPYKGAGPAAVDLIGGQIQMLFTSAVNALQHARSGRVRIIAVTTARRSAAMPEVPTIAESALPGYELMTWYGVLSARGTAREIILKLNREIAAVVKLPEVQEKLAADGVEAATGTPGQFAELIKTELVRIGAIVRAAKITVE
jgi:tripartite-type tricarboxylate transporter receptor subunit TctC